MERLAYYERSKEPWTDTEDEQLRKEYVEDNLDVFKIAHIHKKTPGYIASRLEKLNIIDVRIDARGYNEYVISDLYREIISLSKAKSDDSKKRRDEKEALADKAKEENVARYVSPYENSELLQEYTNAGSAWTVQEAADLINEYNEQKIPLLELCKLHKRLPSGIISRLKMHNIIHSAKDVRGYIEYRLSDLWKKISSVKAKASKAKKTETNMVNLTITKKTPVTLEQEVSELKKEVRNLKAQLLEIQKVFKSAGRTNLVNTNLR